MNNGKHYFGQLQLILIACILLLACKLSAQTIIFPTDGSLQEIIAAKEVRRFIYLRTDRVLPIQAETNLPSSGDLILVANESNAMVSSLSAQINHSTATGGYILKTVSQDGRTILIITGNDSFATLYGAYRFAEHLGVGFDLSIEAIPDAKISLNITGFDEVAEPRFAVRGIHPFRNMMAGPDNWHTSDYMVIMSQLTKMGMNFIGLHAYGDAPDGTHNEGDGPDAQVWIGLESDVNSDGTVNWSSPAYNAHTHRVKNNGSLRIWGYDSWDTDQFGAGASEVFAANGWGNDMMGPVLPAQDNDITGWNAIYNRYGQSFNRSFSYARKLGVKTAIGLEMTLTRGGHPIISDELKARISNPTSDATIKDIYKGVFTRIKRAHPLDYFWLWMDENQEISEADALSEVPLAIQAYNEIGKADFELAFSGWDTPVFLENIAPNAAFAGYCADGEAGGFEELKTTKKWPITWAEEDWGIIQPQTEVRNAVLHAKAAINTNSEGYHAQIWRSRAPSKELNAMRLLQWAYGPTGSPVNKSLPSNNDSIVNSAYLYWCTKQFGSEVAQAVSKILAPMDIAYYAISGGLPKPVFWDTDSGDHDEAPGAIMANSASWSTEQSKYAFVGQLETLRSQVVGAGNLERFDYLLKSMQALRLYGEFGCIRGAFESAMERNDFSSALTHRRALARLHEQILTLKMESITNNNELGEICNIEIVNWKALMMNKWDTALKNGLGGTIPADANPSKTYTGAPFIKVVPTRTMVEKGESLKLNVLAMKITATPVLKYRTIGSTAWTKVTLTNVARSVYEVTIPAYADDFEYCIESGSTVFPVTAPNIYQTVVVADLVQALPGDINGDGVVDLKDNIFGLYLLAGFPVDSLNGGSDVNINGKIGLEEIIYTLRKVSDNTSINPPYGDCTGLPHCDFIGAGNATDVKVTASSEDETATAQKTVDGSGLNGNQHSTVWDDGWIGLGTEGQWIKYDLGHVYSLGASHIWNFNEVPDRGVKNVTISYSNDDVTYTVWGTAFFEKASGQTDYSGSAGPDLTGINARFIKIDVIDNYGETWGVGLGEIKLSVKGGTGSRDTYTVSYSGNGNTSGTAPGGQTKTQGIDLMLAGNSGNLEKTGLFFAGWNTAATGTGTDYAESAIYRTDADLALYARWSPTEPNPHQLDFSEILFVQRKFDQSQHFYTDFIEFNGEDGYFNASNGIYRYNMITSQKTPVITAANMPGGKGVFNKFDLDWDASRIVFDYKEATGKGYRIWMCNIDGSGLTQITTTPTDEASNMATYLMPEESNGFPFHYDDMHPCFTQEGTIMFVSTRSKYTTLCDPNGDLVTTNMYRINTDGTGMEKLTDSPVSEFAPSMMEDGRLVYTRWEYVDKDSLFCKVGYAMNPDGTHVNEIFGLDQHSPPTLNYWRQIPGKPNKFVCVGAPHFPQGGSLGTILLIDRSKEVRSHEDPGNPTPGAAVTYVTPNVHIWQEGGWNFGGGDANYEGNGGKLYTTPYPISEERFLVTCKYNDRLVWEERDAYGIYLIDTQGNHTEILNVDGTSCWNPVPLKQRKMPVKVNALRFPARLLPGERSDLALALVTDVTRGMTGVNPSDVKYLRVNVVVSRPWSAHRINLWGGEDSLNSAEWMSRLWPQVQMGIVPVQDDGSAYFVVPAGRNIMLQALDADYRELQRERTYVNYRPGEFRSCVGCHEKSGKAPPQIRGNTGTVMALQNPPVIPGPMPGEAAGTGIWAGWGTKVIHYPNEIQPILDNKCISCHAANARTPDLSGNVTENYSTSYESFAEGLYCGPQVVENNDHMANDWTEFKPPKFFGSHSPEAKLAARITDDAAHRARLTDSERYRLYRWIDSNYQFYGTYYGRHHGAHSENSNFRRMPTVDEALSAEAPSWHQ